MDFAPGLVNFVLNFPDGQVKFFGEYILQKDCNQSCSSKKIFGLVKVTLGLVYSSYRLPKWQAVKLTILAPRSMKLVVFLSYIITILLGSNKLPTMLPLSPGLPSSPGRPGSPGSPTSPTGPSGPCSPVGPIGPWGPWGPRSPLFPPLPAGPCSPDSPGKPYNRKISLNYMSQVTCRHVHPDVSVVIKIEQKL